MDDFDFVTERFMTYLMATVYVNVSNVFFDIEAAPVRDVLDMSRCAGREQRRIAALMCLPW